MSSIIEQAIGTIVKSDHSGRTRYTAQYKREVVAAFESSSLSAPAFARQCGIKYATNQWLHLEPCFMDGQIEFDNNLTENTIRPVKLGHKNWMFIGGGHTGWRSAVIYTFVEQVRRHGADVVFPCKLDSLLCYSGCLVALLLVVLVGREVFE